MFLNTWPVLVGLLIVLVILVARSQGAGRKRQDELVLDRIRRLEDNTAELSRRLTALAAAGVRPVEPVPEATAPAMPLVAEAQQPVVVELAPQPAAPGPVVEDIAVAPEAVEPIQPPPPPEPPSPPPASRFDWERLIGLRLPVWLGAIALSIAGFFFVSYAIESGFFTPQMRVLAAAAASLGFLAAAEAVRRRMRLANAASIASALGAASIATAYATAYLASITYGLVSNGTGFILTAAVSLLAIAIALAYGEVVALIGIVGGYVAPMVFGDGDANAGFLAVYVIGLTAVTFAVIRWKAWWRLSIVGLVGPAFWILGWALAPALLGESYWGSAVLIALPVIVFAATWPGWQQDGGVSGLRGITGAATPERRALVSAVLVSAVGFAMLVEIRSWVGPVDALAYWPGFLLYGVLAVAAGIASPPHRALQVPILIAVAVALVLWPIPDGGSALPVIVATAMIFGVGAFDQFRRMREPGYWSAIFAFVVLFSFSVALFKLTGWLGALVDRHMWAGGALAIAAAFVALLRVFGARIADERARGQVYASWGGAVTTLVSLAVVLELDPVYFPAASAIATLGLAAVHLRAPVRGLRVLAGAYAVVYGLLLLGAVAAITNPLMPDYHHFIFTPDLQRHALVVLILPGLALLGAATLFQRAMPQSRLIPVFDVAGMLVVAGGIYFLFRPTLGLWQARDVMMEFGPVVSAELALALVAIYLGFMGNRRLIYGAGLALAGIFAFAELGAFILPVLSFWPQMAVPGPVIANAALLAYGLPAVILFAIGWLVRQDGRQNLRYYGIGISYFAVLVTYMMIVVDIRQAYHLGAPTLAGDTSQSEFYAYSIATLGYGLLLLLIGVAFQHRGARAVSFVFVLAATIKVFLFDASELTGLWRVLSFLLMGFAFLGISWAYARFVFGIGLNKPAMPAEPPAP